MVKVFTWAAGPLRGVVAIDPLVSHRARFHKISHCNEMEVQDSVKMVTDLQRAMGMWEKEGGESCVTLAP
jgi:hypothetical protein